MSFSTPNNNWGGGLACHRCCCRAGGSRAASCPFHRAPGLRRQGEGWRGSPAAPRAPMASPSIPLLGNGAARPGMLERCIPSVPVPLSLLLGQGLRDDPLAHTRILGWNRKYFLQSSLPQVGQMLLVAQIHFMQTEASSWLGTELSPETELFCEAWTFHLPFLEKEHYFRKYQIPGSWRMLRSQLN